jgi:hypothetical protein
MSGMSEKGKGPDVKVNAHLVEKWLETQRARPQARPMRTAGFATNKIVRPLSRKHGKLKSSVAQIQTHWPEFAGRFAKLSKAVRVSGTKEGRTLVVEAVGPAATLVQADAGAIIKRIQARLGTDAVSAIRVVQGKMARDLVKTSPKRGLSPREEAELQSQLSDMEDGPLKDALEQMGRNVLGSNRKK